MTRRELYVILIKLIGVYWLIDLIRILFIYIPELIMYSFNKMPFYNNPEDVGIAYIISQILFLFLIFEYSDWIARKLVRIKDDGDKKVDFVIGNSRDILKIGLILLGGLLLILHVPQCISVILENFVESVKVSSSEQKSYTFSWLYHLIYVVFGVILIRSYDGVSGRLLKN